MNSKKPKRPMTGYMLWLNSNRASLKAQYPHLKLTEFHNKVGEIWRTVVDRSVWEEKSAKAKEQYGQDRRKWEIAIMEKQQKENLAHVTESYNSYSYGSGEYFNFSHSSPYMVSSDATEAKKDKKLVTPKRPVSGFMMWLNSNREFIQARNPHLKTSTAIHKKAGEIWRTVDHSIWEEKSARAKEQYEKDMKLYFKKLSDVYKAKKKWTNKVLGNRSSHRQTWISVSGRKKQPKLRNSMKKTWNYTTRPQVVTREAERGLMHEPPLEEENSAVVWEQVTSLNEETNLEHLAECPTAAAIACSHEARGSLHPRESGFVFVPQPQPSLQISYEDIINVKFNKRGPSSTELFDLEITLNSGAVHTFSNIQKEEYHRLLDCVSSKNLLIKEDKPDGEIGAEKEATAYLSGIKVEGAECYLDESHGYPSSAVNFASCHEVEMKTEEVADNLKSPESAFTLFLNSAWDSIKLEYPGLSYADITKIGEEIWRGMSTEDKTGWIEMAAKTVEQM